MVTIIMHNFRALNAMPEFKYSDYSCFRDYMRHYSAEISHAISIISKDNGQFHAVVKFGADYAKCVNIYDHKTFTARWNAALLERLEISDKDPLWDKFIAPRKLPNNVIKIHCDAFEDGRYSVHCVYIPAMGNLQVHDAADLYFLEGISVI